MFEKSVKSIFPACYRQGIAACQLEQWITGKPPDFFRQGCRYLFELFVAHRHHNPRRKMTPEASDRFWSHPVLGREKT